MIKGKSKKVYLHACGMKTGGRVKVKSIEASPENDKFHTTGAESNYRNTTFQHFFYI
jgi:hypothetical protein